MILIIFTIEAKLYPFRKVFLLGSNFFFCPGPHPNKVPKGSFSTVHAFHQDSLVHLSGCGSSEI